MIKFNIKLFMKDPCITKEKSIGIHNGTNTKHGPGSMDRVHGVVHGGPWTGSMGWSMDPGPCFVYVLHDEVSDQGFAIQCREISSTVSHLEVF